MNRSESIKSLSAALSKAQGSMGGASKDSKNPFFKSNYADLASVVEAVKVPFSENGLSYSQFPFFADGRAGVETILMHSSGEWISSELGLPIAKQDAQAVGSALTYARRFSLQAIAGIPSEDDDGNSASQREDKKTQPIPTADHSKIVAKYIGISPEDKKTLWPTLNNPQQQAIIAAMK